MATLPEDLEARRIELERQKVDIERDRLALDKERLSLEKRFLARHIGELIAASIALAGVLVSYSSIRVASIEKDKELAQEAIQKERELSQQQIAADSKLSLERLENDRRTKDGERDYDYKWKLDMMQFLERHSTDVFCDDPLKIKRTQNIMLAAFPPDEVGQLFVRLQTSAVSSEVRDSWKSGAEIANKMVDVHIYLHLRNATQGQAGDALVQRLHERGLRVVGSEVSVNGPRDAELFYFRAEDKAEGEQVAEVVKEFLPSTAATFQSGQENRLLPRHYEIWFPPTSSGK